MKINTLSLCNTKCYINGNKLTDFNIYYSYDQRIFTIAVYIHLTVFIQMCLILILI